MKQKAKQQTGKELELANQAREESRRLDFAEGATIRATEYALELTRWVEENFVDEQVDQLMDCIWSLYRSDLTGTFSSKLIEAQSTPIGSR